MTHEQKTHGQLPEPEGTDPYRQALIEVGAAVFYFSEPDGVTHIGMAHDVELESVVSHGTARLLRALRPAIVKAKASTD